MWIAVPIVWMRTGHDHDFDAGAIGAFQDLVEPRRQRWIL